MMHDVKVPDVIGPSGHPNAGLELDGQGGPVAERHDRGWLEEIEQRLAGISKGIWGYGGPVDRDCPAVREFPSMPGHYFEVGRQPFDFPPAIAAVAKQADAEFIAKAPADMRVLIAEIHRFRAEIVAQSSEGGQA